MALIWEHHRYPPPPVDPGPWEFGWEGLAAIGGFVAAGATVWAVLAALHSARKGRESAEEAVKKQIAASERSLTRQLDFTERERRREHEVDLLLKLLEKASVVKTGLSTHDVQEAQAMGRGLVLALEDLDGLDWSRYLFMPGSYEAPDRAIARRGVPQVAAAAVDEIAVCIDMVMSRPTNA